MFVFECNTHAKNCLVLFLGQYTSSSIKSLPSSIQNAFLDNLTPEIVLVIYPKYLDEEIENFLSHQATAIDLNRLKNSPTICIGFDIKGNFSSKIHNGYQALVEFNYETLSKDIIKSGYEHLMKERANDVLVRAPAGTTFVKPSGKTLEEFIYASQLARNNFEYQFLAMSLLRYSPNIPTIAVFLLIHRA